MAKANFERVENVLQQEMQKLHVTNLLKEAETVSKIGGDESNATSMKMRGAELAKKQRLERRSMVAAMKLEIDRFFKKEKHFYSILETHHEEITGLFEKIDSLDEIELKRLLEINAKLKQYKEKQKEVSDELLVAQKRKSQVNKRFNVNERWLPLH